MTDLRKQANRMMFNQAEEEFVDGEDTIGLGVIGKEGSGRLRAVALQQRQKLSAKAQKKVGWGRRVLHGPEAAVPASLAPPQPPLLWPHTCADSPAPAPRLLPRSLR